ncbi:NADH-quinone oxidoreductase subunit J [Polynucleobacter sp. IMCC30063]|uniref:NADH-quinone oxidoreductase subunit J n=1 Tax=unclassified Polynucleobacter TaxID=2640945 RepID=UPI001F33EA11|nr:NADH-quinone oxidoreductase subunit J [Polynucleobacter sp. IMCC30063]MCE7527021.1 NADH-quinone oxidoreductase subunit J [Polynucleobacter sp. IMCC 30228]MCE7529281.1 NADH-quinone oxidoreductase subunit J [Polynucleobacter sp. IMCC 29146]
MALEPSTIFAIFFYAFAGLLIISALRVVTAANPVHAALFLVLAFFCASGIWMLLQAEFLSLALILVYVGAVMVLFLFVVMMLDLDLAHLRRDFKKYLPVAFLMGIVIVLELAVVLIRSFIGTRAPVQVMSEELASNNTQALGKLIFVDYVYAFEVAGVILLVAIIAAVALTLRHRKDSKTQNIADQVAVKASERLRIVTMPSEMDAKQDAEQNRRGRQE